MSKLDYFESWYPPRSSSITKAQAWKRVWWRIRHLLGWQFSLLNKELKMIEDHIEEFQNFSNDQLDLEFKKCQTYFKKDHSFLGDRNRCLPIRAKALATLAIYMEDTLKMKPYSTQLMAAIAMHHGTIIQLAPGEGKTLALGLVSVLYAWNGAPCHVITANDYLAKQDALLLKPFYEVCGLNVSSVEPGLSQDQLRENYSSNIVYGTAKQLLADFLRDDLLMSGLESTIQRKLHLIRGAIKDKPVMRGLYTVIVDEADSVLIDDSNTPLIISGTDKNPRLLEVVPYAFKLVDDLNSKYHYELDHVSLTIKFTEGGEDLIEKLSKDLPAFWRTPSRTKELMTQALLARDLFVRDRHYVIYDEKVVLIDENTGRKMPGRTLSYGLHQAIEAREGVPLTNPSKVMARRSFQTFFKSYHRICGASGTLQGIGSELWDNYDLLTIKIPSRFPSQLIVDTPKYFKTLDSKIETICLEALDLKKKGIPVLIGTRRIIDSEVISKRLKTLGIECSVLNAKEDQFEAEIIANAGKSETVTVATNMAGRGVDIKITKEICYRGGLQVLMFEPHQSKRVDWQLFGRAGRQGEPGRAVMYVSTDDDLLIKHLPWFTIWLRYFTYPKWLFKYSLLLGTRLAQWNYQYYLWIQRRRLLKRDKLLREQLTFTIFSKR